MGGLHGRWGRSLDAVHAVRHGVADMNTLPAFMAIGFAVIFAGLTAAEMLITLQQWVAL